jgi:hypothetical protein
LPTDLLQPQMELKGMLGKASSIYLNKISMFEWHNSLEDVKMNWKQKTKKLFLTLTLFKQRETYFKMQLAFLSNLGCKMK